MALAALLNVVELVEVALRRADVAVEEARLEAGVLGAKHPLLQIWRFCEKAKPPPFKQSAGVAALTQARP